MKSDTFQVLNKARVPPHLPGPSPYRAWGWANLERYCKQGIIQCHSWIKKNRCFEWFLFIVVVCHIWQISSPCDVCSSETCLVLFVLAEDYGTRFLSDKVEGGGRGGLVFEVCSSTKEQNIVTILGCISLNFSETSKNSLQCLQLVHYWKVAY